MKLKFLHKMKPFSSPSGMSNLAINANESIHSCIDNQSSSLLDSAENKTGISFAEVKSKVLLVVLFLFFTASGYSQTTFSLGASGGYNLNFNHLTGLQNTTSGNFPDLNIGVDGIFNIGEKMRIRAELRYANMNYTRSWNFDSQDLDRFEKSALSISNLDISPRFDYKLAATSKFDLYASAGLRFEFTLGDYERSTLASGEKLTSNLIKNDYTKTQAGAVGGFILKYNVNPSFGITLAPEYTCFFDKFSTKNDYIMQRTGLNLGVEWKF